MRYQRPSHQRDVWNTHLRGTDDPLGARGRIRSTTSRELRQPFAACSGRRVQRVNSRVKCSLLTTMSWTLPEHWWGWCQTSKLHKFKQICVPRIKTKTGWKALSIAGPALWNALHVPLRNAQGERPKHFLNYSNRLGVSALALSSRSSFGLWRMVMLRICALQKFYWGASHKITSFNFLAAKSYTELKILKINETFHLQ